MGVLGSAPFFDQVIHLAHGPLFHEATTTFSKNSATISGTETHFKVPFRGDSASFIGERQKQITIKENAEPILHQGKLLSVKRNEDGALQLITKRAPARARLLTAIKDPSQMARLAGAGILGAGVDLSIASIVAHHSKNVQRKADAQQFMQNPAAGAPGSANDAFFDPESSPGFNAMLGTVY